MPEKTQREQLEAEFPQARLGAVKKAGQSLTYVPVGEVINRLNEVLGASGWSWEVGKVWRDETNPEWVLAFGKMTATVDGETSTKAGEGGVKVKKMQNGDLVDLGDEFKGAASDALKKAAQKFGVALYLARTDQARRYEQPADVFEPTEEGWKTADEYKTLTDSLYRAVKACGAEVVEKMRLHREKIGVAGPPSRDEYDAMLVEFQALVEDWKARLDASSPKPAAAPQNDEKPTDAPPPTSDAQPPESAPTAPTENEWDSEAAHDAVVAKFDALSDESAVKVDVWRKKENIELPTTRTSLARLDAYIDAVAAVQPALT